MGQTIFEIALATVASAGLVGAATSPFFLIIGISYYNAKRKEKKLKKVT